MSYDWPGNVRELRNILERAAILQKGPEIEPSTLLSHAAGVDLHEKEEAEVAQDASLKLEGVEEAHIKKVLRLNGGNYARTARALGISLTTLKRKLRTYGLLQ